MIATKNTKLLISMPQNLSDEVTEFAKELNPKKRFFFFPTLKFFFFNLFF
ncbi:hypothetical protein ACN2CX_06370 [Aliarcobacter butzleri]